MPVRFKLYAILVANSTFIASDFGLGTITHILGILIYDHMATITDEITFIWCRPKALSAILFLINRYVALLGNVYMLSVYLLPIMSHERFQLLFFNVLFFLNKDLAVGHILHRKIYSFFPNKYSFVLY